MHPFKKIATIKIKNPTINIKERWCFLYQFEEGGFSDKEFCEWLDGKHMDIYEFTGRFGKTSVCPWCYEPFSEEHVKEFHPKRTVDDANSLKLTNKAYPLLLDYIRNGNYEAQLFFFERECAHCDGVISKDRLGKCEIPEATRNRPRSIKNLNLKVGGNQLNKYCIKNNIAVIYKVRRQPVKN